MFSIKNKVKAKYKTKNIKTISLLFFFATTNKKIAKTISENILSPSETSVYIRPLVGVCACPKIKITILAIVITKKADVIIKRSGKYFSIPNNNRPSEPMQATPQPNAITFRIFLISEITGYRFMKSLMAV